MEGILYFFLYILFPIAFFVGLSLFMISRKKMIIAKILMAIGLLIPFLIGGFIILLLTFWESGHRPNRYENEYYGQSFGIINNSSIPIWVDAYFGYKKEEMKDKKWDYCIPLANFITYKDILIDKDDEKSAGWKSRHLFYTAIRYGSEKEWPSGFFIILRDSMGTQLAHFTKNDLDSVIYTTMQLEITDSLLRCIPTNGNRIEDKGSEP